MPKLLRINFCSQYLLIDLSYHQLMHIFGFLNVSAFQNCALFAYEIFQTRIINVLIAKNIKIGGIKFLVLRQK